MTPAAVNVALRWVAPAAKPFSFDEVQDAAAGEEPDVPGVFFAQPAAIVARMATTAKTFVDLRMFPPLVSRLGKHNPTSENLKRRGGFRRRV
jgi:hypothetical protein